MLGTTRNFVSEVKVELQKASWPWEPKEKGMKKYKELKTDQPASAFYTNAFIPPAS